MIMDWYVIHTKPRQEARALLNLERQGYRCYLPRREKQRLRGGAVATQREALFPRYLFICLDATPTGRSWSPIRSTLGVSKLLTFGTEPARVDAMLIAAIQKQEEQHATSASPLYHPGDRVQVIEGPFAGIEAIFEINDGDARAMVLIDLLSRQTRLTLPLASLKNAE